MNHLELLKTYGDMFEKQAIKYIRLEETFPRYAEFWVTYVLPYRSSDPSKLRNGYPKILERIVNTHYWILYRLLKAKKINLAIEHKMIDFIDFDDSLSQLSSIMDLVPIIFTLVSNYSDGSLNNFNDIEKYLSNHKLDGFIKLVSKSHRNSLREFAEEVNRYRNLMVHSVSPIRKFDSSGILLIPKIGMLEQRDAQYWSTHTLNNDDYIVAYEMLNEYLNELLKKINSLWEILLSNVQSLVGKLKMPLPESTSIDIVWEAKSTDWNTLGSASDNQYPSVPPSALQNDNFSDPF